MKTQDPMQTHDQKQYLTFKLDGEEYGIDILAVQEIRSYEPATRVPKTARHILGVINLRGEVVPIVDLRIRFNIPNQGIDKNTVIILVKIADEKKARTVGMVVDAVSDVHVIAEEDMGTVPNLKGAMADDYITGIGTINGKMIILLDVSLVAHAALIEDMVSKPAAEEEPA
ncbi:MAG: chemotaxis protein CheW [Pseudomonadales bacterium]|nr:chemotaxis protein CheW [Pseudomonadales bacterium]